MTMNARNRKYALIAAALLSADAAQAQSPASAPPNPPTPAEQRSPIAAFKNGFTLEQSRTALADRDLSTWLAGGDLSVWLNLRTSEALPTAVIPNRQPPRALPVAIDPAIGRIKADTGAAGMLTLDQFMANPQSYAQAFIVVRHGRIVYENYVGMV